MTKAVALTALAISTIGLFVAQQSEPLTSAQLKTMVENMGLSTKPLGDDGAKFEIDMKTSSLNIPIAAETSKSGNYIWFTVYLGDADKVTAKYGDLLKQNAAIQPDFFYITSSGKLMLGVAVDNREVSAAVIKRVTDKLVEDVEKTQTYWKP